MAKTYIRVDDRLIHGQTIVAWCPTLAIQEIIAIDDVSAMNPMLKSIMTMGVPPTYKTYIVTTEQAKDLLAKESDKNRLVIVKLPDKLKELQEEILKSEYIILGNLAKREDTIHKVGGATGIFYLSDTDIEIIDEIVKKGVRVSFQQLPSSVGTSWDTFKKTIK